MKNKYAETIVEALIKKLEGEKEVAMANLATYFSADIWVSTVSVEEQIEKIAEANYKIDALREVENKFGIQS